MRFCILTRQKEAAKNLYTFLDGHSEIKMCKNIFKDKKAANKNHDVLDRLLDDEDKHGAIGFPLHYDQAYPWVLEYFSGNNVDIVLIVREDKIKEPDVKFKAIAKHVMTVEDIKVSKDNKWRNLQARRKFLVDFLKVKDKVLSL